MNGLTATVCNEEDECKYCGRFLNSVNEWYYLVCNEEILGSEIVFELEDAIMNFCEVIVHVKL